MRWRKLPPGAAALTLFWISGPTRLDPPPGVQFVSCATPSDANRAVLEQFSARDRADHGLRRWRITGRCRQTQK